MVRLGVSTGRAGISGYCGAGVTVVGVRPMAFTAGSSDAFTTLQSKCRAWMPAALS